MDGQAEVQLPPGAPAPWAAPLPAPSSSSITPVPSVIHMLCLQSLWREPSYLSCLTGERCEGTDSPITDRRSVASESLRFLALPNQVLERRMRALICLLYGNKYWLGLLRCKSSCSNAEQRVTDSDKNEEKSRGYFAFILHALLKMRTIVLP